ncbi:hypothetical protein SEA_EJIMIX_216 [Mycobacterium phage Ejimix]|uniref:Uncharacterized protein n=1 Tax=Mycobacterium phage Baka TaxID=2902882 RepID=G1D0I8_9CAUD|nr:hypothetical protein N860_gp192 [Mycobacterium phage Redno2]YP_009047021.1 hypothetical protein N857_gp199 [Mycobacterium phage Wanda]YP_009636401.1 hypothetical protein FGG20_gp202 [Mycobacterium phage Baka]ATN89937.1 hypothetical protein SEA_KLEIN_231 [Mycobacterium phage Klein]AXQ52215.1 hypothetical protein SEA_EJIMIX_216 [Mycobacterium phage Ejimix]AXQ52451.1 hypothetical protein SEA_ERICMILLARD_221 [Mycobacterium phage EricMillard]AXQ62622.1 hypothetical protein SEA_ZELINK_217 [Mycob
MSASDYFIRHDLPAGITSDEPMPYGYRRWNGTVWCNAWIDGYNHLLRSAIERYRQGLDASGYVDALYRRAAAYNVLTKESGR